VKVVIVNDPEQAQQRHGLNLATSFTQSELEILERDEVFREAVARIQSIPDRDKVVRMGERILFELKHGPSQPLSPSATNEQKDRAKNIFMETGAQNICATGEASPKESSGTENASRLTQAACSHTRP
jgi:hypothetical protein